MLPNGLRLYRQALFFSFSLARSILSQQHIYGAWYLFFIIVIYSFIPINLHAVNFSPGTVCPGVIIQKIHVL